MKSAGHDERSAAFVLRLMERGDVPVAPRRIPPAAAAYRRLFEADFDGALELVPAVRASPYGAAVAAQVEALCTASAELPLVDVADRPLDLVTAMAAFHVSEAAHVLGRIDDCVGLLQKALAIGVTDGRARTWLRLGLVRGLLFRGRVGEAGDALLFAEREVAGAVARESARCLRAMVSGLAGDPAAAVAAAERIRQMVRTPNSYAHAGIALLAAYGLAACGMPRAAGELLRHGAGGATLPLLPPALRAYGYDMLVEGALAARQLDLAEQTMREFDALDLADNIQLESARETSRGRVQLARGDLLGGVRRAAVASRQATAAGSALVSARAELAAHVPGRSPNPIPVAGVVADDDLRRWLERAMTESGRAVAARPDWHRLSPSQLAVARLAARGLRNRQIADALVVSLRTVEGHIAAILDVLGVDSRVGIVARVPAPRELDAGALGSMTARQREVALLLVGGMSNTQIAERLGVGPKAVEAHVSALLRRFAVASRAALVARLLTGPTEQPVRPARGSSGSDRAQPSALPHRNSPHR